MKRDAWRRRGRMKHPLASQFAVSDRYWLLRRFPLLPWKQRSGASRNRVREASSSGALELTPSARNAASRAPGGAQRRRKVPLRRFVHGGWSEDGEQRVRRAKKSKAASITATTFSHAGEGRGCVVPGTSAVRLALAQSPAGVVESAETGVASLVRRCFRPGMRRLASFNPVAFHLVILAHTRHQVCPENVVAYDDLYLLLKDSAKASCVVRVAGMRVAGSRQQGRDALPLRQGSSPLPC